MTSDNRYEASKAAISKTLSSIRRRTLEALSNPETTRGEAVMLSNLSALFAVARPDALMVGGLSVGPTPEWEGLVELVLEVSIATHEETVASMLAYAATEMSEAEGERSSSESPTADPAAG